MASDFNHTPVLLDEVVELFTPVPPGVLLDATLGGAGHASAILAACPQLHLVGIDRDGTARDAAKERLEPFGDRAVVVAATFAELGRVIDAGLEGAAPWPRGAPPKVAGVLFDLGVSSPQLDVAERGFSYLHDAPLDMRMDPSTGPTASEVLDGLDLASLERLLRENGEDRLARRIAQAILGARPITSTGQLADVVAGAVPAPARRRGHPAKRVFQALRIAVNGEIDQLDAALPAALDRLTPHGRCVVIAYHSGEDKLVKTLFADRVTGGCTCPPRLPCGCGATPTYRRLFAGAHKSSAGELDTNRRAESARLRAVERLDLEELP